MTTRDAFDITEFPDFSFLVEAVAGDSPKHRKFVASGLLGRSRQIMASVERNASRIKKILAGGGISPDSLREDYRLLCDKLLAEELFFRRNQRYRLKTFDEAMREVYSDDEFMARYMNFLLISYVLWDNHVRAVWQFESEFLPRVPEGSRHLEIGPGHGLLLLLAAECRRVKTLTGWDVSVTSVDHTRRCLSAVGAARSINLVVQDLYSAVPQSECQFDSLVMSEVLEHVEDPVAALRAVSQHLAPNALVWINVPVNSPAPDHIYLLRSPEEAVELVRAGGLEPIGQAYFPMTGTSLEQARKHALTISVAITARKAD